MNYGLALNWAYIIRPPKRMTYTHKYIQPQTESAHTHTSARTGTISQFLMVILFLFGYCSRRSRIRQSKAYSLNVYMMLIRFLFQDTVCSQHEAKGEAKVFSTHTHTHTRASSQELRCCTDYMNMSHLQSHFLLAIAFVSTKCQHVETARYHTLSYDRRVALIRKPDEYLISLNVSDFQCANYSQLQHTLYTLVTKCQILYNWYWFFSTCSLSRSLVPDDVILLDTLHMFGNTWRMNTKKIASRLCLPPVYRGEYVYLYAVLSEHISSCTHLGHTANFRK